MKVLRIHNQAKTSEILVKGETGDTVKQMGNYNIRNSVAIRKAFVFGKFFERFFCNNPHGIIIMNDVQRRLYCIKKFNSKLMTCTVSKECYGFTDYIPYGIKRYFVFPERFKDFSSPTIIRIFRAKRGKEKGSITIGSFVREVQ